MLRGMACSHTRPWQWRPVALRGKREPLPVALVSFALLAGTAAPAVAATPSPPRYLTMAVLEARGAQALKGAWASKVNISMPMGATSLTMRMMTTVDRAEQEESFSISESLAKGGRTATLASVKGYCVGDQCVEQGRFIGIPVVLLLPPGKHWLGFTLSAKAWSAQEVYQTAAALFTSKPLRLVRVVDGNTWQYALDGHRVSYLQIIQTIFGKLSSSAAPNPLTSNAQRAVAQGITMSPGTFTLDINPSYQVTRLSVRTHVSVSPSVAKSLGSPPSGVDPSAMYFVLEGSGNAGPPLHLALPPASAIEPAPTAG